jgi:hypothetical protein
MYLKNLSFFSLLSFLAPWEQGLKILIKKLKKSYKEKEEEEEGKMKNHMGRMN